MIRDTIEVWKDGRWVWFGELRPVCYEEPLFKIKIGCHWTDKQVNEFVDQYLGDFISDNE